MLHSPFLIALWLVRAAIWLFVSVTCFRAVSLLRADQDRRNGATVLALGALLAAFNILALGPVHTTGVFGYTSTLASITIGGGIVLLVLRSVRAATGREWRPWHL